MEKLKKRILKRRAKGIAIRAIANEYDINEATLGDWLYFWKHGVKRRSEITRRTYRKKNERPARLKRKWSPEALAQRKICTEINNKNIRFIKIEDTEGEKKRIRFVTKQV